jgi:hypothetical protein
LSGELISVAVLQVLQPHARHAGLVPRLSGSFFAVHSARH